MQRLAQPKQVPPEPLKMLQHRRWLTLEESEQMYLSTRLGRMLKEGFMFWHPGAPSEWPVSYLEAVIAHDMSVQALNAKWKHEADYGSGAGGGGGVKLPELPPDHVAKQQHRNRAMQAYFADLQRQRQQKAAAEAEAGT
jgi:hypothetical protein